MLIHPFTKQQLQTLIIWEATLRANRISPLEKEEQEALDHLATQLEDDLSESYSAIVDPRIVDKLLAVDGANDMLAEIKNAWERSSEYRSGLWRSAIPAPRLPFFPSSSDHSQTLASTPLSLDRFDVAVGDMIRADLADGRKELVGKIVSVNEQGIFITWDDRGPMGQFQATLFYTHDNLAMRLPRHWHVVHPVPSLDPKAYHFFPLVPTVREKMLAEGSAQSLRDPKHRALAKLRAQEELLQQAHRLSQHKLNAFDDDASGSHIARYPIGWIEYFHGNIALHDIPNLRIFNRFARKELIDEVEHNAEKLVEIRAAIASLEEDHASSAAPPLPPAGKTWSPLVEQIIGTSYTTDLHDILSLQLAAIRGARADRDDEAALALSTGALWSYRYADTPVGSLERTADGQRSLTAMLNELIAAGLIPAPGPVTSARDLQTLKTVIHRYNREARAYNRTLVGDAMRIQRPLIDMKLLDVEIARVQFIDLFLADERPLVAEIDQEFRELGKRLGEEKTARFFTEFGRGLVDVLTDPKTLVMIAAGAGAGAVGRAVMVRLAMAGFGPTSTALIGLAVEGIAFHNLTNLGTMVVDADAPLDWGVGANLHSIATLGWLKTAGKGYAAFSEQTLMKLYKKYPMMVKLANAGGGFATEAGAFTAQGQAEKILNDEHMSWAGLAYELSHSTQMVIAFRALRTAEQTAIGKKMERKSIAEEALERIEGEIANKAEEIDQQFGVGEKAWGHLSLRDRARLMQLFERQASLQEALWGEEMKAAQMLELTGEITLHEGKQLRAEITHARELQRIMQRALKEFAKGERSGLRAERARIEQKWEGVEQELRDVEWENSEERIGKAVRIIEALPQGERLPFLERLALKFGTSGFATSVAAEVIEKSLRSLPAGEQRPFVERLVETLERSSTAHRYNLIGDIGKIILRLPAEEQRPLLERIAEALNDPDVNVRIAVLHLLGDALEHRVFFFNKISEKLWDPSSSVWERAADILWKLLPEVHQDERYRFIQKISLRLEDPDPNHRCSAVSFLGKSLNFLPEELRPLSIEKIAILLNDPSPQVRWEALSALQQAIRSLPEGKRHPFIKKIAAALDDADPGVRKGAINALSMARLNSERGWQPFVAKLIEKLSDPDGGVRRAAVGSLGAVVRRDIPPEDRPAVVEEMAKRVEDRYADVRRFTLDLLPDCMGFLPEGKRHLVVEKIARRILDRDLAVQRTALSTLRATVKMLSAEGQLLLVTNLLRGEASAATVSRALGVIAPLVEISTARKAISSIDAMLREGGEKPDLLLASASLFFSSLSPKVQGDLARSSESPLITYFSLGGPDIPGVWENYKNATDGAAYLRELQADALPYRRAEKRPDPDDERSLWLAYIAMDRPALKQDLFGAPPFSWERFRSDMKKSSATPPPFVTTRFSFPVRRVVDVHALINKGALKTKAAELKKALDPKGFQEGLQQEMKAIALPVQRAWQRAFGGEELPSLDAIKESMQQQLGSDERMTAFCHELARELTVKGVSDRRGSASQRAKWLERAVLILAWQKHTGEETKQRIEALTKNGDGNGAEQQRLIQGLSALLIVYGNSVKEATRELTPSEISLRTIDKAKKELKAEQKKIASEHGDSVTVEMIPSKESTDQFSGYIAEDCTKLTPGRATSPDVQFYRMIVEGRYEGVVTVTRTTMQRQTTLIIEIAPRESFKVDHSALLRGIETGMDEVIRQEKYDQVVMSTDVNEQGNRTDMHDAIAARGYDTIDVPDADVPFYRAKKYYIVAQRK